MGVSWELPLRMLRTAGADVAHGVAALRGLGAVDGDVEDGVVVGLLDAQIDEAGDLAKLRRASCRRPCGCRSMSVPSIWMSMGAGRPKLRIWVTMSAGRK